MTQKKLYKTFGRFLKQTFVPSDFKPVFWLWRWSFITRQTDRGFVLPTVTLLLIMLSLVVGTLVFRTFGRTTEVIGQRRQQALYNAATPAIERAKSKIEYLFTESDLPVLATDEDIETSLEGSDYNLPTLGSVSAESRLDLDLDGTVDNAWLFQTDTDGDGIQESVAYSILSRATNLIDKNSPPTPTNLTDDTLYNLSSDANLSKARAKVVRNGPLVQTRGANTNCPDATALSPIAGWERQATNTSKLRKALQVHAVVIDSNSSTSATIEFQQDRQVNFGNKWGAWFRSDLELHPTSSAFNWNGAMHTEGSYFMGDGGFDARLFLVSSPNSCVYEEDASEITMREQENRAQGQFVRGRLQTNAFSTATNVKVDLYADSGLGSTESVGSEKDSIRDDATKPDPDDIALNPIILFTTNEIEGRGSNNTNRTYRDTDSTDPDQDTGDSFDWETSTVNQRIFNPSIDISMPYLDDTYRADDRWGPKIVYDQRLGVEVPKNAGVSRLGEDIASNPGTLPTGITTSYLLENNPLADLTDGDEAGFGLDGYWERRARRAGVRFIVGQRLELGAAAPTYAIDAAAAVSATSVVIDNGTGSRAALLAIGDKLAIGGSVYSITAVTTGTTEDTYTITPALKTAITDGVVVAKVSGTYSISGTPAANATTIAVDDGAGAKATPLMKVGDKITIGSATYQITSVDNSPTNKTNYGISPGLAAAAPNRTTVTWLDPTRWQGDSAAEADINPLYPPAGTYLSQPTPLAMPTGREHETRQWRTLRDNLAAAQATAVYHYRADQDGDGTVEADEGGTFPVACMATTTHSGTAATDMASRTFTFVDTNGDGTINSSDGPRVNFLQGQGTNGLEFAAPFNGDGDTFETEINKADSPLRVALTNLAYFAGDPNGAFPAPQGVLSGSMNAIDEAIHPYPLLTMWGNYSELRRVLNLLSSGTKTYATLSPADQSTLHTASCTLGMLAYSLQVESLYSPSIQDTFLNDIQDEIDEIQDQLTTSAPKLQSLAVHADSFLDLGNTAFGGKCPGETNGSKYEIDNLLATDARWGGDGCYSPQEWWANEVAAGRKSGSFPYTTYDAFLDANSKAYYASFTADDWDKALTTSGLGNAGLSGQDLVNYNKLKTAIKDYENAVLTIRNGSKTTATTVTDQLRRDRMFGFATGSPKINLVPPSLDTVFSGAGTLNGDAVTFFNQGWDSSTGTLVYPTAGAKNTTQAGNTFSLGCSPGSVSLGLSALNPNSELGLLTLAMSVCGPYNPAVYGTDDTSSNQTATIRYPSLFYLFPLAAHYHNGAFVAAGDGYGTGTASVREKAKVLEISEANQDGTGNSYPSDIYIRDASVNGQTTIKYRPVEDGLGSCIAVGCSVTSAQRDGVVNSTNGEDIGDFVTYLGIKPVTTPTTVTNWKTPVQATTTTVTATTFQTDRQLIVVDANGNGTIDSGEALQPAFIDMGLFNSREQMSVRTLRLDLNQMRQKRVGNAACTWVDPTTDTTDSNGLCWLPLPTLLESTGASTNTGAIIYAFREDAVREDAITRPTTETLTCASDYTTWQTRWKTIATASAASDLTASNLVPYFTDAIGNLLGKASPAPQDPPVNPCTLVSPKPVDFYADPDRRPHGFILTNGMDLRRRASSTTWDQDPRGMSFVSDNSVYISGNFNIHSEASNTQAASLTNRIEEFDKDTASQLLDATWSNFYTRSTLDTNFARAKDTGSGDVDADSLADTWRVSAIVSDAVTALSSSFVPGYIDRAILWNSTNSSFNTQNSYGGIRILRSDGTSTTPADSTEVHGTKAWIREDQTAATGNQSSPIEFSRRGLPIYSSSGTPIEYATTTSPSPAENFENIASSKALDRINDSSTTWINAAIVSGLSPARNTQETGGLNNFVRQIEDWGSQSLNIFGSLVQLNFSVSTAPFDQDSWQPRTLVSGEANQYYTPPIRNFGFDVGLLYVPPDPVASRFSSPSNVRSEFYQELAIDDPYIINLRCARRDYNGDGTITSADSTAAGDRNGDGVTNLQDAQVDPKATSCS